MKPAIVKKSGFYLKTVGVFEYPSWVGVPEAATVMGAGKASQWAEALGGQAVMLDAIGGASTTEAIAMEHAPSTKRDGFAASDPSSSKPFPSFGGF